MFVYKALVYAQSLSIYDTSNIDIIFTVIFFVCLFVPMSHIDQKDKSLTENRYLAQYKPLISDDHKFNLSFGADFEKYFQDRFALRKYIIALYNTIYMTLNSKTSNAIYDKKNGFMYLGEGNLHIPTNSELNKNFDALYKFDEWCKKHGIKFYIL